MSPGMHPEQGTQRQHTETPTSAALAFSDLFCTAPSPLCLVTDALKHKNACSNSVATTLSNSLETSGLRVPTVPKPTAWQQHSLQ